LVAGVGLLFVIGGFVIVRRRGSADGRTQRWPTAVAIIALLYGYALVAVTLLPVPADAMRACVAGGRDSRLTSLITFDEVWNMAAESGLAFLTGPSFVQLLSNVILFVPLGLLVGWRTRWPLLAAAGVGLMVSLLLELTQATGSWGLYDCPYRYADLQDLVTNTTGAVLGWLVGRHVLSRLDERDQGIDG
jgi:glycopeptide antibiotics resistance protein